MKKKMSSKDSNQIVPPKPKAKFPEGKKRPERDKSKEIVPPRSKEKPYGGKEDKETQEQKTEKKMPMRSPNTFREDMRKLKKEYKG